MKLYVTSDLHLEFGDLDLHNRDDVDVLILGGDICVARDINRPKAGSGLTESRKSIVIKQFFQRVSERFPHVIMIMGNHEHYYGDFARTQNVLQAWFDEAGLDNVQLLEKSTWQYEDYLFIGGTLWTDFNGGNPMTFNHAKLGMSDFQVTKNSAVSFYRFLPEHAFQDHVRMRRYIEEVVHNRRGTGEHSPRVIVVGHHSPSRQSTHEKYHHDLHMNGCFSSTMDDFILDHPEICLWTHGHTHEDFDYHIGPTRIVCNPRGYHGHEARTQSWQPRLIEL